MYYRFLSVPCGRCHGISTGFRRQYFAFSAGFCLRSLLVFRIFRMFFILLISSGSCYIRKYHIFQSDLISFTVNPPCLHTDRVLACMPFLLQE